MDSHFYAHLYRLRFIERWSLMRNTMRENVAEHSYHVAVLTHALCTIANEIFGRSIPTDQIVTMALFHDVTEVITGDIPTPVKHHNHNILRHFRELEDHAAERLTSMIPDPLRKVYEPLITGKREMTLHRRYVKAADLLDAYLKCSSELSAGNREFSVAKRQIEQSLAELKMEEVEYFLKHFAPSFEKTLDEMTE